MELDAATTVDPVTGTDHPGDGPGSPRRRLAAGRPLPSGRALVGGLLVAVAMLITFAAARGGG